MPKQALESLTESMFYLLMALTQGERAALRSPHLPPRSPPGGSRLAQQRCIPCWASLKKKA